MFRLMFKAVPCPLERLEDLFALRARVWIAEGADPAAFDAGRWTDGHDAHRTHWMVLDGDQLVAGASMSLHDRLADMRRLLERRGWQHRGAGPADPRFPGVEFSVMTFAPGAP